jgi:hypothetical protein
LNSKRLKIHRPFVSLTRDAECAESMLVSHPGGIERESAFHRAGRALREHRVSLSSLRPLRARAPAGERPSISVSNGPDKSGEWLVDK